MKMGRNLKKNNGFTLAELMLVLMIMAVMTTVIIVSGKGIITYVNETLTISEGKQYMSYAQVVFDKAISRHTTGTLVLEISSTETNTALYADFNGMCGDGGFDTANAISITGNETGGIATFRYQNSRGGGSAVVWDSTNKKIVVESNQ